MDELLSFICFLIDNKEQSVISKEALQEWFAEWTISKYNKNSLAFKEAYIEK